MTTLSINPVTYNDHHEAKIFILCPIITSAILLQLYCHYSLIERYLGMWN